MKLGNYPMTLLYLPAYGVSYLMARTGNYGLSALILILAALGLYVQEYMRTERLLDLRAVFSLFWVGGQGISCLKLSHLQTDWSNMTWLCFLLAYLGFWLGYQLLAGGERRRTGWRGRTRGYYDPEKIFLSILGIAGISLACFLFEAVYLGFIPYFSDEPHAYSYFHVSGVHYFTVTAVMVPALTVLYVQGKKKLSAGRMAVLAGLNLIAFAIPFLCVSRFQIIFSVILAVFTYMAGGSRLRLVHGAVLGAGMVCIYVLLTIARNHDVAYLNGIFEMKQEGMPIFVTQPYMYIANNYDNFNCLVEQLTAHTWGLRMLFPVFALTGLKFLKPELVAFPIFTTKTELTTVTLFYDAYYDFGAVGVFVFAAVLGLACAALCRKAEHWKNPISRLFYGQMAIYMMLSFFTTWFSNPTTWFWFAVTGAIYWFVSW